MSAVNKSKYQTKVIGPVLGALGEGAVRVVLALPYRKELGDLDCIVRSGGVEVTRRSCVVLDQDWRQFVFDFQGLRPGGRYTYSFEHDGVLVDLDGLSAGDCRFTAPASFGLERSLVLVSCHNPFEGLPPEHEGNWTMVEQLASSLKDDWTQLVVHAGDQCYNDDVEKVFMPRLAAKDPAALGDLKKAIIDNYLKYWGHPDYRRILAQVPGVAIWDDHDITDGYGGRLDSFTKEGDIKPEWSEFFGVARSAFSAYQASRNSDVRTGERPSNFSTYLDLGDTRIYALDFRSEKNAKKNRLWSTRSEDGFTESLKSLPERIRHVMLVSPTLFYRVAGKKESLMAAASSLAYAIKEEVSGKNHSWLQKVLNWAFSKKAGQELANVTDDIQDSLSSEPNKETLKRIFKALAGLPAQIDITVLTGDVHVGGVSEIFVQDKGRETRIVQIVSSPLSNAPAPNMLSSAITSDEEDVLFKEDGFEVFARNGIYRSKRNFARVFPGRWKLGPAIEFYFEGSRKPLVFPADMSSSVDAKKSVEAALESTATPEATQQS